MLNTMLSASHPYFPDTVVLMVSAITMCSGLGNLEMDCPL